MMGVIPYSPLLHLPGAVEVVILVPTDAMEGQVAVEVEIQMVEQELAVKDLLVVTVQPQMTGLAVVAVPAKLVQMVLEMMVAMVAMVCLIH